MPFDKKEYMKKYLKMYALKNKKRLNEYKAKWAKKNEDKVVSSNKKWFKNNKREVLANRKTDAFKNKRREWYKTYSVRLKTPEHRAYQKAVNERFYKNRPLKMKQYNCKAASGMDVSYSVIQSVYETNIKKYGTLTCYLCLEPILFGQDHLEHKTPYQRGGDNSEQNLGVAHGACNHKKRQLTELEYRTRLNKNLA